MKELPALPREYILCFLFVILTILKLIHINSWTDWAIGAVLGLLLGVKMEQIRQK